MRSFVCTCVHIGFNLRRHLHHLLWYSSHPSSCFYVLHGLGRDDKHVSTTMARLLVSYQVGHRWTRASEEQSRYVSVNQVER